MAPSLKNNDNSDNTNHGHSIPENPYKPFALETGDWLYHEDVIKKIKKKFEDHPENKIIILQDDPWSGKTSTLRRIENSTEMMGEKKITIYIESRKKTGLDS